MGSPAPAPAHMDTVNRVLRTLSPFLDRNNQRYLLLKENHLPSVQSMHCYIRYFETTDFVTVLWLRPKYNSYLPDIHITARKKITNINLV